MEKEQTAVQYLLEQMGLEQLTFPKEVIDKAKEMEKKQILDTYIKSYNKASGCDHYVGVVEFAEHYYDKTFKSK